MGNAASVIPCAKKPEEPETVPLDMIPEKKPKKKKKNEVERPARSFGFQSADRNLLLDSWNRQTAKDLLRVAFNNACQRSDIKALMETAATQMKRSPEDFMERHATQFTDFFNTAVRNAYYMQDEKAYEMAEKTGKVHGKLGFEVLPKKMLDYFQKAIVIEMTNGILDKNKKAGVEALWVKLYTELINTMKQAYSDEMRRKGRDVEEDEEQVTAGGVTEE